MTETNWYIEVTKAETEQDAIEAMTHFLTKELETSSERLDDLTDEVWTPPEDRGPTFDPEDARVSAEPLGTTVDYEKGRLDTLRLLYGMVMQAKWSAAMARKYREDVEDDDAG